MKASKADWQFCNALLARRYMPLWAARFAATDMSAADWLHAAINARAKQGLRDHMLNAMEKWNACAVLKMVRKRGDSMRDHMERAISELKTVQPARVATYSRWLRRMWSAP